MNFIIKILLFPFNILYYIFGLVTGKNNYYIISKNTVEFYNIFKFKQNTSFSENELFFLSGVSDAYNYLLNGEISLSEIYNIAEKNTNLNDFLFEFINTLLVIDIGYDKVQKGLQTDKNINIYKNSIQKGINNAINYNSNLIPIALKVIENKDILSFIKEERSKNIKKSYFYIYIEMLSKKDYNNIINLLIKLNIQTFDNEHLIQYYAILGICFQELGNFDKADYYYSECLNLLPNGDEEVKMTYGTLFPKYIYLIQIIETLKFKYFHCKDKKLLEDFLSIVTFVGRMEYDIKNNNFQEVLTIYYNLDGDLKTNNKELKKQFYLYTGIAFQELGDIKNSEEIYNKYLLLSEDYERTQYYEEGEDFLFMKKEIEKLGFIYKSHK